MHIYLPINVLYTGLRKSAVDDDDDDDSEIEEEVMKDGSPAARVLEFCNDVLPITSRADGWTGIVDQTTAPAATTTTAAASERSWTSSTGDSPEPNPPIAITADDDQAGHLQVMRQDAGGWSPIVFDNYR